MNRITVETSHGTTLEYQHYDGLFYPSRRIERIPFKDMKLHIESMKQLEIRDDDIYLATFEKSGTHWVWEILMMLIKGKAEYEVKPKEYVFLEFRSKEDITDIPSPRIINSHFPLKHTPKRILQKGIKIVHVQRNPKDIFVSLYNHFKASKGVQETELESFGRFLQMVMGTYGFCHRYPWYKYVKEWENFTTENPSQILNLYYEDIKEDPVREIKKMNEFLQCGRSDDLIEKIANACSFQQMKEANKHFKDHSGLWANKTIGDMMYRKAPCVFNTVELPKDAKMDLLSTRCQRVEITPYKDMKLHIESMKQLEIRDEDLYLATYEKSGTHWVWEILMMLRKGRADYETKPKEYVFLDFKSKEQMTEVPSPRIINSHFPVKHTPTQVMEKKIKLVHVQRNPKDIFVSLYNHMKTIGTKECESFNRFLPLMMGKYGIYHRYPWYKYVKEWERFTKENPDQILNLYYEDMKEDPVSEIKKINEFLQCGRSEELIDKIAEACSFQRMKVANKQLKEHLKIGEKKFDGDMMYRKGQVGDWKNWFTVTENEMMDAWLQENLVDTNLKFRYEL